MSFFFIILIFCLILFLFRLYHVANDDYVLIKKNISLDEIFNCAFFYAIVSLLFARIFYVVFNPSPVLLSPLGFLVFPYYPGLSLIGGFIGGTIALILYGRWKKFPMGRVFDFFTVSFTFILPFGLMGYLLLSQDFTVGGLVKLIIFTIIALAANLYLYPKANSLEIKDGSISFLFLIFFSLTMLLTNAIDHSGINNFIMRKENFIFLALLIIGIVLLVRQEVLRKGKRNAK